MARIAPQSADRKYARLTAFQKGHPDFNYNPLRRWTLTLLHGQEGALEPSTQSMEQIERGVRLLMGSRKGVEENISAARALRALADETGIRARSAQFHNLTWGAEGNYAFWLPLIADLKGRPCLLFLDPRLSSSRLDVQGRHFVYSAMNAHIRV